MRSLSDGGRKAAHRLADRLVALPIAAVYSSPYRRATETVSPLAARLGLDVQEHPDLRERILGAIDPIGFDDAVAATWADFDFAHTGGESCREAQRRGVAAVRLIVARHPKQLIVASTHGNILALVLNAFDPRIGFDFWRSLEFPDVFELDLGSSDSPSFRRLGGQAV